MNRNLRKTEVQAFIKANLKADTRHLAFQKNPFEGEVSLAELLTQIETQKKALQKIPQWADYEGLIYPKISLEQSSSAPTAQFKSTLVKGKTLADLTGGLGIDSYFFAQQFEKVIYVEPNEELHILVKENFERLGIQNMQFINQTAAQFLSQDYQVDAVFIDPSRRDEHEKKVYFLENCVPNVIELLPQIFEHAPTLWLKAAPMLDLKRAFQQLELVQHTWVLALENEVKELLFKIEKNALATQNISTINIQQNAVNQVFEFDLEMESQAKVNYSLPQKYLIEPNKAILKAGAFFSFANHYQLNKLHPHTHLYTTDKLPLPSEQIAGRVFEIIAQCNYRKKEVLKILDVHKANIATRNFPDSPEQMYKKLGLNTGGSYHLWGIRDAENQAKVLITKK